MLRKSLVPLAAVGLVVALVVGYAQTDDEAQALARDGSGRVPMAAPGTQQSVLPGASTPAPMLLIGPDVPASFGGAVTTDVGTAAEAALSPADQKAVDKLQKQLDKAQAKQAKLELKGAQLADAIAAAQSALTDAEGLPDGPAKDKARREAEQAAREAAGQARQVAGQAG